MTDTCCSTSSKQAYRRWGSNRPPTSPPLPNRRASRPESASSATEMARRLVDEGIRADLLIGNNVLAHVPDLNDFVAGMAIVLAADGRITMEFPHLLQLIRCNQFDTIYHEHFSYFSLLTATAVFQQPRAADIRRRRDTDPRRVAADIRLPRRLRGPPDLAQRGPGMRRPNAPLHSTALDGYLAYPARVERVSMSC